MRKENNYVVAKKKKKLIKHRIDITLSKKIFFKFPPLEYRMLVNIINYIYHWVTEKIEMPTLADFITERPIRASISVTLVLRQ
jgi:hypothetical protein